jgi:hypothetical protein
VSLKSSSDCDGGFPAKDIGACFCYSQLDNVIRANGIAGTLNRINQLGTGICRSFFQQYSLSVGLTYTSVFTTIVVNVLLRRFLKYLARQEAHNSSDAEQGSILSKIFLSNYVTMAIIVLVAYGKAANLPAFFKAIRIFDGVYDDFTTAWYGNIGFYLMTTFILQSFSPLLANILMYTLIKPAQRWFHHKGVRCVYLPILLRIALYIIVSCLYFVVRIAAMTWSCSTISICSKWVLFSTLRTTQPSYLPCYSLP